MLKQIKTGDIFIDLSYEELKVIICLCDDFSKGCKQFNILESYYLHWEEVVLFYDRETISLVK